MGRGGLAPACFFEMGLDEVDLWLRGWAQRRRDKLEIARLLMWSVFQSQCGHKISIDDVMNLPDLDKQDENEEEKSDEEWEKAVEMAKKMKEKLYGEVE